MSNMEEQRMANRKQPPIDIESLYAEEAEPREEQAGITLEEFMNGWDELRKRYEHNTVQTGTEEQ